MNKKLEAFARETLIKDLRNVTNEQFILFKRMYSFDDLTRNIEETVNNMPCDKLGWAMEQVERTLIKNQQPPQKEVK